MAIEDKNRVATSFLKFLKDLDIIYTIISQIACNPI